MTKFEVFLNKHGSTILSVIGAGGVITTSVLAVKATPKAMKLIENEKQARKEYSTIFADNKPYEIPVIPDLSLIETIKIAWKPYIPAAISGISTIACIFGANYLNSRTQASLMSAYALLDNTFKEYRNKTKELYPEESPIFEHEIIKSKFDPNMELHEDKELFFDYQSMRWFESTIGEVKQAEQLLNYKLSMDGIACLNDFYDLLGMNHVPYGYQLGWSTYASDKCYGDSALTFDLEKVEMEDGLECNIVTITFPPSLEYIC